MCLKSGGIYYNITIYKTIYNFVSPPISTTAIDHVYINRLLDFQIIKEVGLIIIFA